MNTAYFKYTVKVVKFGYFKISFLTCLVFRINKKIKTKFNALPYKLVYSI